MRKMLDAFVSIQVSFPLANSLPRTLYPRRAVNGIPIMTWEIGVALLLLLAVLIAFVKEWGAPELVAMTGFALVIALGLIKPKQALEIFQNDAPLTIGALFVVTAGLQATGAIDQLSHLLTKVLKGGLHST